MRTTPQELGLFALVLSIPLAGYGLVFRHQNSEIEAAQQEIEIKRSQLTALATETARNADLEAALAADEERLAVIEKRLPSEKGVHTVIRQVSDLAVEAGLEPPTLRTGKAMPASSDDGGFWEQPLELTTRAPNGKALYEFVSLIERMPRITRITDMELTPDEPSGGIVANFVLSIYFERAVDSDETEPSA